MILLLSDDLLDASKTTATARAVGLQIAQCKSLPALILQAEMHEISCCIVDLQCPDLDIAALVKAFSIQETRPCLIGYGSHVDAARLKAAREAGFDKVMPRSIYFEEMPEKIVDWQML